MPEIQKRFAGTALDARHTPVFKLPDFLRDAAGLFDEVRPSGVGLLSPAAKRQRMHRLLGEWLAAILFVMGFEPEVRPGADSILRRGEQSVEPGEYVDRMVKGEISTERHAANCAEWMVHPPSSKPSG